ncbi:MAG: HAD-IIA family hydrolase [Gemmatimonadota bacterium]|nr:HAD-IIA family hydrolase [Gemmatimonadota bacterium]MDH4349269.1 HAD-IIA family hydrolase [Gemmatimonadota bacterium]
MGDPELPRPLLNPAAFLLDLDGTLYTDRGAIPGGPATTAALRARGIPFRCVTNTTSRPRAGLAARLASLGYDIGAAEILTPVVAASAYCRSRGLRRIAAYTPAASLEDLEEVEAVAGDELAEAVVVGDLGEEWDFARMQAAFARIRGGAALVALSRDRYFLKGGVLTLDAGAFVAGLEYAAGAEAIVVGKPSPTFYGAALAALDIEPHRVAMVGDDLWSDIQGAQEAGMQGWLVRTGKFREESLCDSNIRPDRVITSIAALLEPA